MDKEEFRPRVRFSEVPYYDPIRIRITDWKNLKVLKVYNSHFLLIDSEFEYRGRKITLCVPYKQFIYKLRDMDVRSQRAIIDGKVTFDLMKSYRYDNYGMRFSNLKPYDSSPKDSDSKEIHSSDRKA